MKLLDLVVGMYIQICSEIDALIPMNDCKLEKVSKICIKSLWTLGTQKLNSSITPQPYRLAEV